MSRILLAEDDEDMRRFLVKALERAGYEVSDFDNGASAYERLREEPFSLLLTDIVMPEMDGIELLMAVRKHHPALRVIAMSGGGRTGQMDFLGSAEKLGASAVLQKPFTFDGLTTAIARAGGPESSRRRRRRDSCECLVSGY